MKKLLRLLIVFISLIFNLAYAENLNEYSLDDFACNYYQTIIEQVDSLIENDMYYEAETEIEKLYNSRCRTKDVAERYLHILYKIRKLHEAYTVASDNNLLDSNQGLLLQADMAIVDTESTTSRSVYDNILIKSPYDKFAQMSLTNNYIYIGSELTALNELTGLEPSNEIQFLKAKAYYNLEMYEDAYNILKAMPQNEKVLKLENEIKRKRAYQNVYGYELYIQKLDEEFKLDANKFAFSNSFYEKNMQIFLDYILYVYKSGLLPGQGPEPVGNITNEIRLGTQGRVNEKFALRADLGLKIFQDYGVMILSDTWVKYYFNDDFNVKVGFHRNNTEQTFLSAVGVMIDNKFTGQVADNNWYLDTTLRLPKRGYLFTKSGIGFKDGYNMPLNMYWEGMVGIGKLVRYDLSKPFLQKISIDLVSYNSGYQKNLKNIYDSKGLLYGGYFSPIWYSDNTVNMNFSGKIKNKFVYGCGGFAGWQFAVKEPQSFFIWGASVYGKYRVNDYISTELQYRYYKYADITRNQLIFDLVISIFKKEVAKK